MISLSWLVGEVLYIYEWLVIIRVIMSWFRPQTHHPAVQLLHRLTDPVLDAARRIIPPVGAMDFSPLLVFLVLGWVRRFLVVNLARLGL